MGKINRLDTFVYGLILGSVLTSLVFFFLPDFRTEVVPPKHICKFFDIEQFYAKRLVEFRSGKINSRQYRDSLYVDLETYMIKNK